MPYGTSAFGFEDLEAYKAAREFRKGMYQLAERLPGDEKYALAQQIRRAAVSVTNNIAEGYGRHHWQETLQFVRQARASLMELVDDLNVCADQEYGSTDSLNKLRLRAEEVVRLINGYANYLRKKKAES